MNNDHNRKKYPKQLSLDFSDSSETIKKISNTRNFCKVVKLTSYKSSFASNTDRQIINKLIDYSDSLDW